MLALARRRQGTAPDSAWSYNSKQSLVAGHERAVKLQLGGQI